MAILGVEAYNPSSDILYRQNLVSGIQQMGAAVQNQLRTIRETNQLEHFGNEIKQVDPAAQDFPNKMVGIINKYPLAAHTQAGAASINLLGDAHKQFLTQQNTQNNIRLRSGMTNSYDPSSYSNGSPEAPLPNNGPAVSTLGPQNAPPVGTEPSANFTQDPMSPEEAKTVDEVNREALREGPAKGIPRGGLTEDMPANGGAPVEDNGLLPNERDLPQTRTRAQAQTDAPKALTPEQAGIEAYHAVRSDPQTKGMKPSDVMRLAQTARQNAIANAMKAGKAGTTAGEAQGVYKTPEEAAQRAEALSNDEDHYSPVYNKAAGGWIPQRFTSHENAKIKSQASASLKKVDTALSDLEKDEKSANDIVKSVQGKKAPDWISTTGLFKDADGKMKFGFADKPSEVASDEEQRQWKRLGEANALLAEIPAKKAELRQNRGRVLDVAEEGVRSKAFTEERIKISAPKSGEGKPGTGKSISLAKIRELGKTPEEAEALGYKVIQ